MNRARTVLASHPIRDPKARSVRYTREHELHNFEKLVSRGSARPSSFLCPLQPVGAREVIAMEAEAEAVLEVPLRPTAEEIAGKLTPFCPPMRHAEIRFAPPSADALSERFGPVAPHAVCCTA
jgi:hypothetical protein